MSRISTMLVLLVAFEHFYILYLEMFAITSPAAKRSFGLDDSFLSNPKVRVMFANQGLYNGFLAAGLMLSVWGFPAAFQHIAAIFFTACVLVAALFGALTASKKILVMQGFPALLALLSVLILK